MGQHLGVVTELSAEKRRELAGVGREVPADVLPPVPKKMDGQWSAERPERLGTGMEAKPQLPGHGGEGVDLLSEVSTLNPANGVCHCRFCAMAKRRGEGLPSRKTALVPPSADYSTPPHRTVPEDTDPELVFLCRHVYDFRHGRILKNPQ